MGSIFLDDLLCLGNEATLLECQRAVSQHSCTHSEDVGVVCGATGMLFVRVHVFR